MKLLLTHGYFITEDKVEQKIMRPYPPLGLLYISAFLEQHHIDHEVFDSTFSSFPQLFNYIEKNKPKHIGIYVNFLTRINVLKLIKHIRSNDQLSDTKIILGGPDTKHNIDEYLTNNADYLVIGEGEQSFYELINSLENKTTTENIPGIAYSDKQGKTFVTGERPHILDIGTLPVPNRKKINIQAYLEVWKKHHNYSSVTLNTQRGCPFTCKWCSHAVYGDTYRRRPVNSVVQEIKEIIADYNPDAFWFVDDVFTMSEKWILEFQEAINKHEINIKYECITRADRINVNVLKVLKNTGCTMLWIGAESGSQKVIDLMDRKVDIQRVREMIIQAKSFGIKTGTFIMLGYPGETSEDIDETINHIKSCNPDVFTINTAYPIKGTKLYEEVRGRLIPQKVSFETIDRDIDFVRTYRRKYYDYAIRKVYNEVNGYKYRLDRKYTLALKLKIKSYIASIGMIIHK